MDESMPDEQHNRRWEDMERLAQAAARQEITKVSLTVDRLDADVRELKSTVYGNPGTRRLGMVDRLDKIEGQIAEMGARIAGQIVELGTRLEGHVTSSFAKLDDKIEITDKKVEQQIDEGQARTHRIEGVRMALYFLAAAITLIGGPPAIAGFLKAFGITP